MTQREIIERREEAEAIARERFPNADDIRPQMLVSGEIAVHVWKNSTGHLVHTEVYAE